MPTVAVMLHNVRSAHNVGSIFRTAEAAGVSHVYLSGYTPQPIDRFGRPRKDVSKTALGAEGMLPWIYAKSPAQLITRLKKDGWRVVAVEQGAHASDYRTYQLGGPTVFLFGNEVRGVSPSLIARCDAAIEIPMYGKKESLNVSVAVGVVLFQLRGS